MFELEMGYLYLMINSVQIQDAHYLFENTETYPVRKVAKNLHSFVEK